MTPWSCPAATTVSCPKEKASTIPEENFFPLFIQKTPEGQGRAACTATKSSPVFSGTSAEPARTSLATEEPPEEGQEDAEATQSSLPGS